MALFQLLSRPFLLGEWEEHGAVELATDSAAATIAQIVEAMQECDRISIDKPRQQTVRVILESHA